MEQTIKTTNSLDCCKDKNCEICGGLGYIPIQED